MESTQPRENVDVIEHGGRRFVIVGTAHVSEASVALVESVIAEERPDCVAIELCEARYQALSDPDRWKKMDVVSVIRQGRLAMLVAQLMLASFQRKIGKELKVSPGQEMMAAVSSAKLINAKICLADRDVKSTMKRTWAALGWLQKLKLGVLGPLKLLDPEKVEASEIESLKRSDVLEDAMKELSAQFPGVKHALIDERDRYLAEKIRTADGNRIVAVVGAGHVPGIKRVFGTPIDLEALVSIPKAGPWGKVFGWSFLAVFVALIAYGFVEAGAQTGAEMALSWIWINALAAALGAALALGHPLSVLAAALSAPMTTLHPLLASGWFAGLTEAMVRKPTVADLEATLDDLQTIRGLFRNRVTRIILVTALTNLFGMAGSFIALGKLAHLATSATTP
jgi:pheromone shutdown-related protein TraB